MASRVLIVDDQKDVSRLLKSAIETIEAGRLQVLEAPSGEEAILEVARGVDLLVTDFRLPGITGIELMKKFKARNPNIKVILVTGVTDQKSRDDIANSGADAYFYKPVSMSEFLAKVEQLTGLAPTIVVAPPASEERPVEKKEPERPRSLADTIIDLRQKLDAKSVMLLDTLGHVEAEAGELPDPRNKISVIASLMGVYSAAQKVASLNGRTEGHLHLFEGVEFSSVFLPVRDSHTLYVVGKGLLSADNMPKTLSALQAATDEVIVHLTRMNMATDEFIAAASPVPEAARPAPTTPLPAAAPTATTPLPAVKPPAPAPAPAPVLEEVSDDFLALLGGQVAAKKADASDFWDTLVEKGTTYAEPDKLTFEQAQQLGLAPDSKKK